MKIGVKNTELPGEWHSGMEACLGFMEWQGIEGNARIKSANARNHKVIEDRG